MAERRAFVQGSGVPILSKLPLAGEHLALARHYNKRVAKRVAEAAYHLAFFAHEFDLVLGNLGFAVRVIGELAEYSQAVTRAELKRAPGVPLSRPDNLAIGIHQNEVIACYP